MYIKGYSPKLGVGDVVAHRSAMFDKYSPKIHEVSFLATLVAKKFMFL